MAPAPHPTTPTPRRRATDQRRPRTPYAVLGLGVLMTALVGALLERAVRERDRARFQNAVEATQDRVRARLDTYIAMLLGTRGHLAATGEVSRRSFSTYVAHLDPRGRFPGIQGIGWSERIAASDLAAVTARRRAEGDPDFHVWPTYPRPEYHAIVYLEPLDRRNAAAIGYDMFTEPTRREAMAQARDTGRPAASGRVTLVQEIDLQRQAGFLVYLPVYHGGEEPTTVEARRRALAGFVYSPFRADDLLAGIFGSERQPRVAFAVYDGPTATPAALLHRSPLDRRSARTPRFVTSTRLDVAGRPWTLVFRSTAAFDAASSRRMVPAVIVAGLLASLALFVLSRAQVRAGAEAERNAARLGFLAEATATLAQSLDPAVAVARVARASLPALGTWCLADLFDEAGTLSRIEVACVDPARADVAAGLRRYVPAAAASPTLRALRSGEPVLIPEVTDEMIRATAQDATHLALLRATTPRAALIMPLNARGRSLGVLTFLAPWSYTADDAALAGELAQRAALAVDNARLYTASLEAVRARDVFIAIASHELKTPLTSLQLQVESLLRWAERSGAPDLARVVQKTTTIRDQARRLGALIEELLDVSRLVSGKLTLELGEVDLAALVREVVGRYRESLATAGCELRLRADAPVVGEWDRARLEQVLTNLLSNAMKYGAGRPIEVSVTADGERAELTVRDEGIGIAAADHAGIFERFERRVSERNYGGFGLGLWIARELVRALGGTIAVQSAPGQGATFTVALPRSPAPSGAPDEA